MSWRRYRALLALAILATMATAGVMWYGIQLSNPDGSCGTACAWWLGAGVLGFEASFVSLICLLTYGGVRR